MLWIEDSLPRFTLAESRPQHTELVTFSRDVMTRRRMATTLWSAHDRRSRPSSKASLHLHVPPRSACLPFQVSRGQVPRCCRVSSRQYVGCCQTRPRAVRHRAISTATSFVAAQPSAGRVMAFPIIRSVPVSSHTKFFSGAVAPIYAVLHGGRQVVGCRRGFTLR